jgi:DNA-binding IclR family transcriptional regulator
MEQTVQKALNLLEALVQSGQPRRLTELARQLGLTKPNVYRLLSTLTALGYVKKDPATSLYSPTLKLWEMGSLLVRDVDLVGIASPRLRRLCDETRESVQLAVFDSGFAVYVDKVDSAQPLTATTSIGSRVPATATSTGKAMLAWLTPAALDQAMPHITRFTPATLMKRRDIERDLEETRRRGYAINQGELREGVAGIAGAIRDRSGGVVAAISVWGPLQRIMGAQHENLARMVIGAARDISRDLGHLEPAPAKPRVAQATTAEVA